jgi:hypothetical protein
MNCMRLVAIATFLFVAACTPAPADTERTPESAVEEANTTQASDDPEPVVIEPAVDPDPEVFTDTDPSPLTPDELVGMWGLRANCGQPTVFVADGTLTDYTGQTGQWSLVGNSLTITRGGRTHTNEVNPLNANAFTAGPPEDGSGRTRLFAIYRRC